MDRPVILVSAVYGDIGCSVVRSLREFAKKVIGCDMKPYSPVSHLLDNFYKAPAAKDTTSYMAFLKEIIVKEKINYFVPVSESEIEVLNTRRMELATLGVKLLLNNRNIIDTFLDKLKTVQYLDGLNIKVPRTMLLSNYDNSFEYPLIIKSRTGYGSKNLRRISNLQELEYAHMENDGSLLIQECIGSENEEYTTGVFSDGRNVSSITFRRKLGFGSLSIEAVLSEEPNIDKIARMIADDLNLIGSINIQSRRVGDDFMPFEINPRLSSTLLFRKKFGFDDAIWWINVLNGKGYVYKKKFKSGRAVRCLSECYFDMVEVDDENR